MASNDVTLLTTTIASALGIPPQTLLNWLSAQINTGGIQHGTATLGTGGSVTVSGVTLTAQSTILVDYNTPGVNADYVYVPLASRNVAGGSFAIDSANTLDTTSTVDWTVIG